jgi:hypothetical protein
MKEILLKKAFDCSAGRWQSLEVFFCYASQQGWAISFFLSFDFG